MPTSATETILQQAAAGLTYPSETDAPWTAFAWPDATGVPTAEEIRHRGHQKPDARMQEVSVDELFAPLVLNQDWYGDEEKAAAAKSRTLMDTIKRTLTNAKAFRVGERKVAIYVVGVAKDGGWAGLKTIAVET